MVLRLDIPTNATKASAPHALRWKVANLIGPALTLSTAGHRKWVLLWAIELRPGLADSCARGHGRAGLSIAGGSGEAAGEMKREKMGAKARGLANEKNLTWHCAIALVPEGCWLLPACLGKDCLWRMWPPFCRSDWGGMIRSGMGPCARPGQRPLPEAAALACS